MERKKKIALYIFLVLTALSLIIWLMKNKIKETVLGSDVVLLDKINELVKKHEGFRSKMYYDTGGMPTIGYGTLIDTPEEQYLMTKTITRDEAFLLMQKDLRPLISYVNTVPGLNTNQKAALVSFAYNVGLSALNKSTLMKKVRANPNDPTIRTEFNKWVYDNGRYINGLANRRQDEANIYFA